MAMPNTYRIFFCIFLSSSLLILIYVCFSTPRLFFICIHHVHFSSFFLSFLHTGTYMCVNIFSWVCEWARSHEIGLRKKQILVCNVCAFIQKENQIKKAKSYCFWHHMCLRSFLVFVSYSFVYIWTLVHMNQS